MSPEVVPCEEGTTAEASPPGGAIWQPGLDRGGAAREATIDAGYEDETGRPHERKGEKESLEFMKHEKP